MHQEERIVRPARARLTRNPFSHTGAARTMINSVITSAIFLGATVLAWAPAPLSRPTSHLFGVPPRSPRPTQFYDEAKIERTLIKISKERLDPEYDEDIAWASRRLFELRLRRDQRLPVKPHEFKLIRKHIARLKTAKRADELRASGHNFLKRKPRTRRERKRAYEKRRAEEQRRAKNRARLLGESAS